jgi:ubiquinone/menaquinone biosynthesis C-methylase UbiE
MAQDIWKKETLAAKFLDGIRAAIPLAEEQINVMLKILSYSSPNLKTFLDLGCGDGIMGRALLSIFPDAKGTFLDFSEYMLKTAEEKLGPFSAGHEFICYDYSEKNWIEKLNGKHFDAVISGFSIHHQPDTRKKEIYKEIFELLNEGGIFLNMEHVSSKSDWGKNIADNNFIDSLFSFHKDKGIPRELMEKEYHNREEKDANILAPVEEQVKWLDEIGYKNSDCFFKIFELALFGGLK